MNRLASLLVFLVTTAAHAQATDDAPVREGPLTLSAQVELLETWRGRLLDEQRPSLAGPVSLAAVSLPPLIASIVLFAVLQPGYPAAARQGFWVPPIVALAAHFAFAIPATVLFPEKIRARAEFDAAPQQTLVDSTLAELEARRTALATASTLPLVPLDDDALLERVREPLRAAPAQAASATAYAPQLRLLERRAELRASLPDASGPVVKMIGGIVLGLSSVTMWSLLAVGAERMFVRPGLSPVFSVLFIVAALATGGGSLGLFFSGRSELAEVAVERERMEAEIRDVERRIEGRGPTQ